MGLPLTMTPDYDTFECQFAFGRAPDEESEFNAKNTPCLSRCPSAGGLRVWHNGGSTSSASSGSTGAEKREEAVVAVAEQTGTRCQLMGED